MWWSNLVQLRWFLWAAHSDRAQDAAEGADAASPVSQLALLELERTAYGALLELAWTGALLPGEPVSRMQGLDGTCGVEECAATPWVAAALHSFGVMMPKQGVSYAPSSTPAAAASSRSSAHRETDRDLRMWAGHSNGKESRTSSLGHASSDSLDLVDALVVRCASSS